MEPFVITTPKGVRQIGPGYPAFIIAEMSGNHSHSYEQATKIIDAAATAGVDAVKLQTYTADTITLDVQNEYFTIQAKNIWQGKNLHTLYHEAATPWEWQPKLKTYGESKGLVIFSTPFDPTAVEFLEKMNVVMYKVASFEVVDIPLLERIGATKKPVIMSRGMATQSELKLAIKTLRRAGCPSMALLHCISSYPAKLEEMNLSTIPDMARRYKTTVGLSDHSLGTLASVASIALGGSILEKHIILDRHQGGPDAPFSLEPQEWIELVKTVHDTQAALGSVQYGAGAEESKNVIYRKSLFVAQDIKAGEEFTEQNIRSVRPGHGLAPKYYAKVLGRHASQDIKRGTPLSWNLIKK